MKKLLFLIGLLISVHGFSQLVPPNYTNRSTREGIISFHVDSSIHIRAYNGVPSGLPVGAWTGDGALGMDTTTGYLYGYQNATWIKFAKSTDVTTASNIGSGFRLVVPNVNQIKTIFEWRGLRWDSTTNANALTPTLAAYYHSISPAKSQSAVTNSYSWSLQTATSLPRWKDGVRYASLTEDTLLQLGGWHDDGTLVYTSDSIYYSVDLGATWTLWPVRMPYPAHTFVLIQSPDGYSYIIGADSYTTATNRKSVYRTRDFRTFTAMTTNAEWGDRYLMDGFADEDGYLYILGGMASLSDTTSGKDDVWISKNYGATWTAIQTSVAIGGVDFLGGNNSNTVEYLNRKVYVFCGDSKYSSVVGERTFSKKVFSIPIELITDKTKWVRQTDLPFSTGRQYISTAVFNGVIAVGFGNAAAGNQRDLAFFTQTGEWVSFTDYLGLERATQLTATHAADFIQFKNRLFRSTGNTTNQTYMLAPSTYASGLGARDSLTINISTRLFEQASTEYAFLANNLIEGSGATFKKFLAPDATYIGMGDNKGVWIGTGITGSAGATIQDTANTWFRVHSNGRVIVSNNYHNWAGVSGYPLNVWGKTFGTDVIRTQNTFQADPFASTTKKMTIWDESGFLDSANMSYNSSTKNFAIGEAHPQSDVTLAVVDGTTTTLRVRSTSAPLVSRLDLNYNNTTTSGVYMQYDANAAEATVASYYEPTETAQTYGDIIFKTKTAGGSSLVESFRVKAFNGAAIFSRRVETKQGADVASAAGAITLGTDGNVFEITGTSAITLISNVHWQNGSEVTLLFTSTATLTDGTANSGTDIGMELAGNVNFVASADDVVTLVLTEIGGTQRWREKCRSVN